MSDDKLIPDEPFDYDSLTLPQDFDLHAKKELLHIPLKKPAKFDWFRTHLTWQQKAAVLKIPGERSDDVWVLCTPLLKDVPGHLVTGMIFQAYLTRRQVLGLWPLRVPKEGRTDAWAHTALEIAGIAQTTWVQLHADQAAGSYAYSKLADLVDEPEWPDLPWAVVRDRAFKAQLITSLDHPVLRQVLKGR